MLTIVLRLKIYDLYLGAVVSAMYCKRLGCGFKSSLFLYLWYFFPWRVASQVYVLGQTIIVEGEQVNKNIIIFIKVLMMFNPDY